MSKENGKCMGEFKHFYKKTTVVKANQQVKK